MQSGPQFLDSTHFFFIILPVHTIIMDFKLINQDVVEHSARNFKNFYPNHSRPDSISGIDVLSALELITSWEVFMVCVSVLGCDNSFIYWCYLTDALCVYFLWLQDDPCFHLHFDKVRTVTAISCSAKYAIVRALVALSDKYFQRSLNLQNFDWAYIKPTSFYSNRGDCVVLTQICFYAFNLVCLSMCPVPLDT